MAQESSSDFSIVKNYIELKSKYDTEFKQYTEKMKGMEEKFKTHVATLEEEIRKRNAHIKNQEAKLQELTAASSEKDEQLKSLGLQVHKLKMETGQGQSAGASQDADKKKRGFFK